MWEPFRRTTSPGGLAAKRGRAEFTLALCLVSISPQIDFCLILGSSVRSCVFLLNFLRGMRTLLGETLVLAQD